MNAKQLLDNIKFLADVTKCFQFGRTTRGWNVDYLVNRLPSIAEWNGEVHMNVNNENRSAVLKVLKEFGVDATIDNSFGCIVFSVEHNHDIVAVLADVIERQRDQKRLQYYKGMDQNVAQLIQQMPYVKHGMFSRGVNAMKNQVQVLANIREQKIR